MAEPTAAEEGANGHDIFAGLTPKQIKEMRARGTPRRFAPGDLLFERNDPAQGLYVIDSGLVKQTQWNPGASSPPG